METNEIYQKKQLGDASRIAEIVNAKRAAKGEKTYAKRTIRAMLNGERTMKDDVCEVATKYLQAQQNLSEEIITN